MLCFFKLTVSVFKGGSKCVSGNSNDGWTPNPHINQQKENGHHHNISPGVHLRMSTQIHIAYNNSEKKVWLGWLQSSTNTYIFDWMQYTYSGAKKYLVSHKLCKFSHLKIWQRPVIFIIGTLQLWQTNWEKKSRKSHCRIFNEFICKLWWKISIWYRPLIFLSGRTCTIGGWLNTFLPHCIYIYIYSCHIVISQLTSH